METGPSGRGKSPARVLAAAALLAPAAAAVALAAAVGLAGEPPAPDPVSPGAAVFVPGDEAFLGGLFEDGVVAGCRWDGTRVGPREAVSTLACAGGAIVRVRLAPLDAATPGDERTSVFAVGFEEEGAAPAGLRRAFLARLGERARAFRWASAGASTGSAPGPDGRKSPFATRGHARRTAVGRALRSLGRGGALLLSIGLLAAGAGLLVRRRKSAAAVAR